MKLKPSLWLFLRNTLGVLIAAIFFTWLYHANRRWSFGETLSFALLMVLAPCFLWLAFVPSKLEVSDESLHIRFAFRRDQTIDWSDLRFWGNGGQATFLLQFSNRGTIQIALFAFPRSQRKQLIDFLTSRFPQQKARGWLGVRGFR